MHFLTKIIKPFFILSFLGLSACSNQQAYYGLQFGQKNECQKYLPNNEDYQRCLETNDLRYEEYQRRRDELKTNPNAD